MRFIHVLLFCLIFVANAVAQGDLLPAPAIEDVYLAKDDGRGKPGEPVSEFNTTDIPIHCVVVLDTQTAVTVKMNFVAVEVAGVKPETRVVSASYTTKGREDRVNFLGQPDGKWTPGKYRVDLFLDGKAAKSVGFLIKEAAVKSGGAKSSRPIAQRSKPARRSSKQ